MEEVMNYTDLNIDKSNWKLVKFGDVVAEPKETCKDIIADGIEHVVGLEHIDSGDIHLRKSATIEESTTFTKKFRKGDVLFGRRRAYLKKAAQAEFDGICSGDITVFRGKKELLPELLPFIVHNEKFFDYAIKHSAGGLSPRVKFKDLANYEFLLPPKAEQAHLAELLWAMDEVIEREREVWGKAILQKEITSRFYIESEGFLDKKIKNLRIKDFSKVQTGTTPLRSKNEYFENGQTFWVKTLDLNNGKIYNSEEKITQLALDQTSCKVRPVDTVLVAMYGGFNQIGRTGILKIPAATNQAISAITVDNSIILPKFLLLTLNTKLDYWKKVAISSRKDPNITKNDVENFPLLIPPLAVQEFVLKKMEIIDNALSSLNSRIENSKALQKSLINQVF